MALVHHGQHALRRCHAAANFVVILLLRVTDHVGAGFADGELHVATGDDSAVFETTESALTLDYLLTVVSRLADAPTEFDELIYQPDLLAKFGKAKRSDSDRLRILPRRPTDRNGAAVVAVGSNFVGAVAGLTYDQLGPDTVSAFLSERQPA